MIDIIDINAVWYLRYAIQLVLTENISSLTSLTKQYSLRSSKGAAVGNKDCLEGWILGHYCYYVILVSLGPTANLWVLNINSDSVARTVTTAVSIWILEQIIVEFIRDNIGGLGQRIVSRLAQGRDSYYAHFILIQNEAFLANHTSGNATNNLNCQAVLILILIANIILYISPIELIHKSIKTLRTGIE